MICNNDGSPFQSDKERNEFIVNSYRDIYKKSKDEPDKLSGCIDDFLGPQICQHHLVKQSKLTLLERDRLGSPLSLNELDEAILQTNKKSAAGIDGLSTEFILKYWSFFRIPLLRFSICCFASGELSPTFRSACIRLIPKKGDTSQLKNWRPISIVGHTSASSASSANS